MSFRVMTISRKGRKCLDVVLSFSREFKRHEGYHPWPMIINCPHGGLVKVMGPEDFPAEDLVSPACGCYLIKWEE